MQIYNTLTRSKEEFKPLVEGHVGMYVCGPTVYGHSHIGHAKSYVSFDAIIRYLRYTGYKVTYVQNITDVGHLTDDADQGEDKLQKRSKLEKVHPMEIAEAYTRSYYEDMDAMGLVRPDISPRATGHIIEQIEVVKSLIEKGNAYVVNGSVYFDVTSDPGYGKLSGRNMDEAESGTRVDVKTEKRNPADFALWKNAEPEHIMRWPSPWGIGFPGWHVECSAMSMKYLGETFDIHGGGMDNQFPHHECEIAQSECATGKQFVRYWIHNNLVTVGGQKMGKSLGNVILLKDAYKKYPPVVTRFFILQSHYRGTLDFSDEALEGAARGLEKLLKTARNVRIALGKYEEEIVRVLQHPKLAQEAMIFDPTYKPFFEKACLQLRDIFHVTETDEPTANVLEGGRIGGSIAFDFVTAWMNALIFKDFKTKPLNSIGDIQIIVPQTDVETVNCWVDFTKAMDDDFNTPKAIASLFDMAGEANRILSQPGSRLESLFVIDSLMRLLGGTVLGIVPNHLAGPDGPSLESSLMDIIISLRVDLRAEKLWAFSDKIRDSLTSVGIVLEDKKEGPSWHKTGV